MVVETFVSGSAGTGTLLGICKEPELSNRSSDCFIARDEVVLDSDRICREGHADRRYTRRPAFLGAIPYQPIGQIDFIYEVLECVRLKIGKQLLSLGGEFAHESMISDR